MKKPRYTLRTHEFVDSEGRTEKWWLVWDTETGTEWLFFEHEHDARRFRDKIEATGTTNEKKGGSDGEKFNRREDQGGTSGRQGVDPEAAWRFLGKPGKSM